MIRFARATASTTEEPDAGQLHVRDCTGAPKPQRDGRTALSLTPLEFIDHLVALIPPPRLHRHRYHGVLAPSGPLRLAATAYGRDAELCHAPPPPIAAAPNCRSPARYQWALLLARLFETLPLTCTNCGADMPIIVFVPDVAPVARFLNTIGVRLRPL